MTTAGVRIQLGEQRSMAIGHPKVAAGFRWHDKIEDINDVSAQDKADKAFNSSAAAIVTHSL